MTSDQQEPSAYAPWTRTTLRALTAGWTWALVERTKSEVATPAISVAEKVRRSIILMPPILNMYSCAQGPIDGLLVRKYSAGDSERQIEDVDPLVAVDDAFAPDGFEIGERLFRGGFLGGFSRRFQFLNAIARSDEHVPGFREVRFVAERSVPRNNLGIIVRERENFVGSGDHTVDIAARTGVDVGIHAVEKRVGHRNHVGLLKMNVDVRIRMRGSKVLEREGFAICLQLVTGGEGLLRQ